MKETEQNQVQRSLLMIKPVAFKNRNTGKILTILEENGFEIIAIISEKLSKERAKEFYAVHKEKEFYEGLTDFMSTGTIVAVCLQKENCVADLRKIIGNTNPVKAEKGTIRNLFATSLRANAVHASDSPENALKEIKFYFPNLKELKQNKG